MVSPADKRVAAATIMHQHGFSQRRAAATVGLSRGALRQVPARERPSDPDAAVRAMLHERRTLFPRHGYRRMWAWLRFDLGHTINIKKVHRLWREEHLQVRPTVRRKRAGKSTAADSSPQVVRRNQVWAVDFQFDSTVDGRPIKIASMIDEYTRQSLLSIVDRSITADRLCDELEQVIARYGAPTMIRLDNGPEFISAALQQFCRNRIKLAYIEPGTPWTNGRIESFNNRLRQECLNRNHWASLLQARVVIADFKTDYNRYHRHSSLGYLTPNEYAQTHTAQAA